MDMKCSEQCVVNHRAGLALPLSCRMHVPVGRSRVSSQESRTGLTGDRLLLFILYSFIIFIFFETSS